MKIQSVVFNIYLQAVLVLLVMTCGCKSTEEKKRDKEATLLRFHIEVNRDGTPYNQPVPVFRSDPVMVNVSRDPFLDEGSILAASVVDVDEHGGYAIRLQFDEHGTLILDNYTTSYRGQRLVIYAQWTEIRWLAAPRITKRVPDGILIFTPDCSREEAERIVRGLNNVAKRLRKKYTF
ncbi:MAG: hypothetical protein SFY81_03615 [Verrucomicrobiota bacterium]|nr:hypothetical protein [Verrucomicrobiota bacterium]